MKSKDAEKKEKKQKVIARYKAMYDKRLARKSFWAALARAVGVLLSVGAGTALREFVGNEMSILMWTAFTGFVLMWVAEYISERS